MKKKTILLGEMLVDKKLITIDQLEKALIEHKKTGAFLGATLVKLGMLKEEVLFPVLAEQLGIRYVKLSDIEIDQKAIDKVGAKFAYYYKVIPIRYNDNKLIIGVSDPLDIHLLDDMRLLLECEIEPVLCSENEILEAIRKYYGIGAETLERMSSESELETHIGARVSDVEDIEDMAEDASIVKFVNQVLLQAYQDEATDIHLEPQENDLKVRYRIDGILHEIAIPPTIKHFQQAITSRIKIMAHLNIAERRLPQDGRIKVKVGQEELDLRVSTLPTPHGESINIRLLSSKMIYSLEKLGLLEDHLQLMDSLIQKPHGIIFVTGPTGSGKTTTLYACLQKIKREQTKIITIEDPIEYQIDGITQIQVMPKIGLTFAAGLRSMLRHDPDIMMVGEVRDYETAEITIRSSLTGHLVFSTLHTNDAAGGITRLLDMGIEPFLVASSVECFIAQRLVRLVCPHCKQRVSVTKEVVRDLGISAQDVKDVVIFEGKGCEQCRYTGYRGRTAIYEFLVINDLIRKLIMSKASADVIKKKAVSLGFRSLVQDGWLKIKMGLTTPSEVLRMAKEAE